MVQTLPRGARPPRISASQCLRPGRVRTSTGARLLEVQHMGRYRREKASQKSGQHIPEEVLHGVTLLPEDGPEKRLVYSSRSLNAACPISVQRLSTPGFFDKKSACWSSIPSSADGSISPRPAFSTRPPRLQRWCVLSWRAFFASADAPALYIRS